MKNLAACLLCLLCTIPVRGNELKPIFQMDFDSPIRIGSEFIDMKLPERGFTKGKFGKGYHFQRNAFNYLAPGVADPTDPGQFKAEKGAKLSFIKDNKDPVLQVESGAFTIKDTPVTLANRRSFFTQPMTAATFSCSIKGPAGTKVTLHAGFRPQTYTAAETKAFLKKYANNKGVNKDPAYAQKFRPDIPGKLEVTLNGKWQRVAFPAQCDVRPATKQRLMTISAEISGKNTVQFKKMQLEATMYYPLHTYQPTSFLPGRTARTTGENGLTLKLNSIRRNFPVKEGTLTFFFKVPQETNIKAESYGFFCYGTSWRKPMWVVDNGRLIAGAAPLYIKSASMIRNDWTHFALVWNEKETTAYINGVKQRSVPRKFKEFSADDYIFCIGKNMWSERAADAVMDEVMLYAKALDAATLKKQAEAKKKVFEKQVNANFRVQPFSVQPFYRNDPDAGITMELFSAQKRKCSMELNTDFHKERIRITLNKGWNTVKIPFRPELRTPGKGKWQLSIRDGKELLYNNTGDYEVRGQLRKDLVRFVSWGGEGAVPIDYELKLGINARNARPEVAGEMLRKNIMVSMDVRNHRDLPGNNFDVKKAALDSRAALLDFRDSFAWYGTVLNSEAAGAWPFRTWNQYQILMEEARKRLGFEPPVKSARLNPDHCFAQNDPEIKFDSNGVFKPGKAFKMLYDYRNHGDKILSLNEETGKIIKAIRPDNMLWTEPAHAGLFRNVDMGADWVYMPAQQDVVGRLRNGYAHAEIYGKYFQPTLTMYYWINSQEKGVLNGKTYLLPRSVDDLTANCWIAAGITPLHDMCFFNTYGWYDAETKSKTYLPMKGMADKFGTFMRKTFIPAANLLRDMGEPQARVALVVPQDISYYSEKDWNYYRVRYQWLRALSYRNVHYDVVYSEKLRKKGLDQYHTLIVPMRSKASEFAHAQLMKASKKAQIVVDSYCPAVYPNMIKLNYKWSGYDYAKFAVCDQYAKELGKKDTGRSFHAEGSLGPVMYFERLHKGIRYFIVVNNHWKGGYLSDCAGNKPKHGLPFTPYGVAQRAKITFRPEANGTAAVYDFNTSSMPAVKKAGNLLTFETDLKPGEGKVFCIYPRKFTKLNASLASAAALGKTADLKMTIRDTAGKNPNGRQLVEITVLDGAGKKTDECGIYTLENGKASIPIRIALNSKAGKWQIRAKERTSGLTASVVFTVKNK